MTICFVENRRLAYKDRSMETCQWLLQVTKVEDYHVPDKGDEKWSDSGNILKKANRKIWL